MLLTLKTHLRNKSPNHQKDESHRKLFEAGKNIGSERP